MGFYGVGFDMVGFEDFKKKQYFKGKLFIDEGKSIYKSLGYKQGKVSGLFNSEFKKRYKKANQKGIKGDFKGDGYQLGGTVVLSPSGEVIFHKRQKYYGDDPTEDEITSCVEDYFNLVGLPKIKS